MVPASTFIGFTLAYPRYEYVNGASVVSASGEAQAGEWNHVALVAQGKARGYWVEYYVRTYYHVLRGVYVYMYI